MPQVVSGLVTGQILTHVFDNEAINVIMVAGVSMLFGAALVYFIKDDSAQEAS